MLKAFEIADEVLRQGVQSITDLIVTPMYINLDFADIENVMRNSGIAHMGIGRARGEERLIQAIQQAVHSPMLETSIKGATKIIMSIKGGVDLDLHEVSNCGNLIRGVVDGNCNIIFGADIDPTFNDEVQIIIIATGFARNTMAKKEQTEKEFNPLEQTNSGEPALIGTNEIPPYVRKLRETK